MKKFHILFDARKVNDYGIGSYIRGLLPCLWNITPPDISWTVIVPQGVVPESLLRNQPPGSVTWIPFRYGTYHPLSQVEFPWKISKYPIDIVHVPHFPLPRWITLPAVVTLHDAILLRRRQGVSFWKQYIARSLMSDTAQRAHRVLTVSRAAAKALVTELNLNPDKVVPIHNGLAPEFREELPDDHIKSQAFLLGLPESGYILYVGNVKPHKNIGNLIEAWRLLRASHPGLSLILAGVPKNAVPRLSHTYSDEIRTSRLIILPKLELKALRVVYRYAMLYVQPSLEEGFCFPILEAMASGVPVACSDIPVFREIAGDAAVFFRPQDPSDMAQTLSSLLRNPNLCQTLIHRGYTQVAHYTWEEAARKVFNIYLEILRTTSPGDLP